MAEISRRGFLRCVAVAGGPASGEPNVARTVQVMLEASHGPCRPDRIPLLPGLNIGRTFYEFGSDPPRAKRYEPAENGGYKIHNGPDSYNHILMGDGVWLLLAGDKPRVKMRHRTGDGGYARPGIVPGLGVGGQLRVAIRAREQRRWLDEFDSIETRFAPGMAQWCCTDNSLGVRLVFEARPLISWNGFIATVEMLTVAEVPHSVIWAIGQIRDHGDHIELRSGYARLANPALPHTVIFAGPMRLPCQARQESVDVLVADTGPTASGANTQRCAVFEAPVAGDRRHPFVCVWGYEKYDAKGVEDALRSLEGKPFADSRWLADMKRQWFHHWIGRGLAPETKFLYVRSHVEAAIEEVERFWASETRLRIRTPDSRFDNVVNNAAADVRYQFEYPAFIHGLQWAKYGKINCGYYGQEAAGYHKEVKSSLKFISGGQDAKGRLCYLTPAFATLRWAEEVDFYYVEQVWHHYRWTGDLDFLRVMWPSVRRSLEHALQASDPDEDGLMTGYYEFWNNDMHSRGGLCVVQTAMAWAAVAAARNIAVAVGDRASATRYAQISKRIEQQFNDRLWDPCVGAYCSAEWNGDRRPHPEAQEQFLPVMRGLGDPFRKYMAMRYVRDTLFFTPRPGVTLELMNDWWPIGWSHHYVANGDTALSVLAAAKAGDIDKYWPALKTVSESAYLSKDGTLCHTQRNDGTGLGMKHLAELQGPFLQSVVEGLFGVEPDFGNNLLVLRPNLPREWEHAEISTPDFTWRLQRRGQSILLTACLPVARRVRAELPVRGKVRRALLNSQDASYRLRSEIGVCRVVLESEPAREHRFDVWVGTEPVVEGECHLTSHDLAKFTVHGAAVARVIDPQGYLDESAIHSGAVTSSEVVLTTGRCGRPTFFLELRAGESTYFQPLDVEIRKRWSIVQRYIPGFTDKGPSVSSPRIDVCGRALELEVENHTAGEWSAPFRVTVSGETLDVSGQVPARSRRTMTIDLGTVWNRLSPGTTSIRVESEGYRDSAAAVQWEWPQQQIAALQSRLRMLDLNRYYNINLDEIYSPKFRWRLDYTGKGVGVDWRKPMPRRDQRGYVLLHPPMNQFLWGCLPEQYLCDRYHPYWEACAFGEYFMTPIGVPFSCDHGKRILALSCTEPYDQLPSSVMVRLPGAMPVEKIYLLTANLTKSLKCYYPGAEVVVRGLSGSETRYCLTPPYTMSCISQNSAPQCYAIPFGKLKDTTTLPSDDAYLAITDVPLQHAEPVREIGFRCVATETLFGLVGVTLLLRHP